MTDRRCSIPRILALAGLLVASAGIVENTDVPMHPLDHDSALYGLAP